MDEKIKEETKKKKVNPVKKKNEVSKIENTPVKAVIKVDTEGGLIPDNYDDLWRVATGYVRSGMLPVAYDTAEKVITGMQYAKELKLHPLTALKSIAVIKGTPSLFGDLPLALVKRTGELDEEVFDEYLIAENYDRICVSNKNLKAEFYGAVCVIKRKGGNIKEFVFTVDDAKKAGLWGKNVWNSYPKLMIKYRVRSMALKDVFPDVLNGICIAEYDNHTIPDAVEAESYSGGEIVIDDELNGLVNKLREVFKEKNYNKAKALTLCNKHLGTSNPKLAKKEAINNLIELLVNEGGHL